MIKNFKHRGLQKFFTTAWSVRVNKNWRITFSIEDGDAVDVDLEDYH